jgi:hypothetical protein
MRAAGSLALLLGLASAAAAQVPSPSPPATEAATGWDGRLPPAAVQPPPPERPGTRQDDPPEYPQTYGNGYAGTLVILPPLRHGWPRCSGRAPPYFAGGYKPRGPYSAWNGSALPLADDYGVGLGYGYGPRDPYALDPRDCAPARSWNGDEGPARQFYVPPSGRR